MTPSFRKVQMFMKCVNNGLLARLFFLLYHTPIGYMQSKKRARQRISLKDKAAKLPKEKQTLLSRIKRLGGQVAAVERTVTGDDKSMLLS
jgi:cell division protein FtsB